MNKHAYALIPTLLLVLVAVFSCNLPQILPPRATETPTATATATATATRTASPTATITLTPSATATASATPFALDTRPELERYIYVDQLTQRMYFFESGVLTKTMLVSTGSPEASARTPAWEGTVGWYVGTFFSFGTYADDGWFLFNDGFLIHSLPYLLDEEGNKIYQDADAQGVRPASHGCIRLFPEDMEWFKAWGPEHVPITISDPYTEYWKTRLAELALTPTATASPTTTPTETPEPSATPTDTPEPSETPMPEETPEPSMNEGDTSFPFDTRPDLERYIYVDQFEQRMHIFERGALARTLLVSTGLPEPVTTTPAWDGLVGYYKGTFFSFGTYADDAWFLFDDGFLIHSLPYILVDGVKVYQDADAQGVRPASHGCIRLFPEDMEWFKAWGPEGVPITISDPHTDYWRAKLAELSLTPTATAAE